VCAVRADLPVDRSHASAWERSYPSIHGYCQAYLAGVGLCGVKVICHNFGYALYGLLPSRSKNTRTRLMSFAFIFSYLRIAKWAFYCRFRSRGYKPLIIFYIMSELISWIALIISGISAYYYNRQAFFLKSQISLLEKQLNYNGEQLRCDHERSRRELAVELCQKWAIHLNRKSTLARKLVENFSDEQARSLFNNEPIILDVKHLSLVKGCLPDTSYFNNNGISFENDREITLQEKDVSEIRWLVVSYLNLLETIFAAWHYGIAEKQIIECQFGYLVAPDKGHLILERFRQAAGGANSFPAIKAFVSEIITQRDVSQKQNGKTALASSV
jgi:hypothetical protein